LARKPIPNQPFQIRNLLIINDLRLGARAGGPKSLIVNDLRL